MDVINQLAFADNHPIKCIDMHTTGEPTRIVVSGYPELQGTLLQQRVEAKSKHDNIRKRLLLEPRGHYDMYGAILRPQTELTQTGEAHIGVLFMTNDGYSTMCGHATIALGRFLVDTHDEQVFPRRKDIKINPKTLTARLYLHAPCGLVEVIVAVMKDGHRSDPSQPVAFVSVPSFTTGINVRVPFPITPTEVSPPSTPKHIKVDFSYGGAFFAIVKATDLGFPNGLQNIDFSAMDKMTKSLKAAITTNPDLQHYFTHPDEPDLSFLYSIIVVDNSRGLPIPGTLGAETSLCYFADQSLDRSPTGSGVAARVALACEKGLLRQGEGWTFHSLVSNAYKGKGGFAGFVVEGLDPPQDDGTPVIRVDIKGYAYYTGTHTFVVDKEDPLGDDGFLFNKLS